MTGVNAGGKLQFPITPAAPDKGWVVMRTIYLVTEQSMALSAQGHCSKDPSLFPRYFKKSKPIMIV